MVSSDYRMSTMGRDCGFPAFDCFPVSCVSVAKPQRRILMVFLFAPEYTCQGYGFYPGEYYILHSYSAFACFHSTDAKYAVQADGSIWLLNVCA
jgi:hypothetical protein